MNLCNLIQLKMTFIKLHYFLEHELLVLSPQGICTWIVLSVSVHLPLAIIPWAPSLQDQECSFTTGTMWVSCSCLQGLTTGSQNTERKARTLLAGKGTEPALSPPGQSATSISLWLPRILMSLLHIRHEQ